MTSLDAVDFHQGTGCSLFFGCFGAYAGGKASYCAVFMNYVLEVKVQDFWICPLLRIGEEGMRLTLVVARFAQFWEELVDSGWNSHSSGLQNVQSDCIR